MSKGSNILPEERQSSHNRLVAFRIPEDFHKRLRLLAATRDTNVGYEIIRLAQLSIDAAEQEANDD